MRNLKKAVERDPNDVDTLLLLCNCYLISEGAGFAAVDRTSPDAGSADALDSLPARLCRRVGGNLRAGVEPYRQMFEMDPDNPMARLFYAWILALNGRQDSLTTVLEGFQAAERETVPARSSHTRMRCQAGHEKCRRL